MATLDGMRCSSSLERGLTFEVLELPAEEQRLWKTPGPFRPPAVLPFLESHPVSLQPTGPQSPYAAFPSLSFVYHHLCRSYSPRNAAPLPRSCFSPPADGSEFHSGVGSGVDAVRGRCTEQVCSACSSVVLHMGMQA